ncbi:reverse transcriptase domain-containing protein [Tanacetum coccineum]
MITCSKLLSILLFKTTNLRNEITRFQQRFDESFYEAWDRFNDLLRACPHHGFSELHQLDTFYNALNANDQDSLNSAAGGNFLDKMPRECLRIIESKSKVRNSRNKAVVAKVSSNSSTPGISPDVAALTTEVSELKNLMKTMLIVTTKRPSVRSVKASLSRFCVTCGGAHSYKNCPATDGNVYQDNIQEYVSQAAAANFNQGNSNSRPPMVSNQIRPPGTLPSQTVTNPREHVNVITTRSGKTCEGPSTPLVPTPIVSTPLKEPEQNLETSMDKVQKPSSENTAQVPPPEEEESIFMEIPKPKAKKTVNIEIQEPNSPKPTSYQPKLPYPERMKVRENDKPSAQHSRFLKMFKQLRLEIGLKDALVEMPKFNKWLSSLLRNKEKLEEIAITTVNAECSAIIMNKVPEKLKDPGKFLIPCALQELDRTSALADSRASINLLPHSIYKQLGLEALTPTRMTLELANRSITHPMGIAEDVVVRVDGFTFLADFVVIIIDLYEETLTLRVGKEELVYYADKSEKNKHFVHAISVIDFSKDDPFSGSTTTHSDDPSPKQNESSITFSPRSDPLHHEFAGELLTLPSRNDREFGEYLSLMIVLCEISTSRSQENVHQSSVIESLPVSPIPVEDM